MEFWMDFMGFLVYDRFLEFSFRSSQFCSLLVYVTLPLRDTPNQFPTYIYSFFFSISLNTNIILLEDSFSLLSLYLFQVYDPISWMEKSPRFYRFLKLCNSCLRLLILQIHFFLPLSTSTVLTTSKMMFPLKSLEYLRKKTRNSETWMRRGMFDLEWCRSLVWMTK